VVSPACVDVLDNGKAVFKCHPSRRTSPPRDNNVEEDAPLRLLLCEFELPRTKAGFNFSSSTSAKL
jgi:hypothetical protein